MDIKQQIHILIGLQQVDAQLMELQAKLKALPARLEDMAKDLREMEAVLEAEKGELTAQDKWKAEKEEEHAFLEAQITRTRQQLQGVRAHRDALALQRQLDVSRKQLSEMDDEMLQTLQAVEARREAAAKHETSLGELRKVLAQSEVEIRSEIETLQAEVAKLTEERDARSVDLSPEIRSKYQSLASRRHPTVVEARDGRCTGCNMALRPQLYNTLFHANTIEVCPQCYRMIYLKSAVFGDPESGQTP
ncbi:MAG: C4-type zinc ribbon domain-containing protein [Polyangia bacterium]|nr:C4-type zinc ribbon domain-containing protein [Polyangia bacterium]